MCLFLVCNTQFVLAIMGIILLGRHSLPIVSSSFRLSIPKGCGYGLVAPVTSLLHIIISRPWHGPMEEWFKAVAKFRLDVGLIKLNDGTTMTGYPSGTQRVGKFG